MARCFVLALCLMQLLVCACACFSSSGRTRVQPGYDSRSNTFGVSLEHQFSDRVSGTAHAGVGMNGRLGGSVGVRIKLGKRSIENAPADTIHRELFMVMDWNKDGQLDVEEWSVEGGKVLEFASLLADHDQDKDEKISLAEFQQTQIHEGLRMILDRLDVSQSNEDEE